MKTLLISVFAVIANFLTLYITYLTATNKLTDNRYSKFLKKIKRKGWVFFGAAFVLIIIQSVQTYLTNEVNEESQVKHDGIIYSKLKKVSDSSVFSFKEKSDSSVISFKNATDTTTYNIIKLLAQNNLKYDVAQKTLSNLIRDSSKTKVVETETPYLSLRPGNIEAPGISFLTQNSTRLCLMIFESQNAASRNIKLDISIGGFSDSAQMFYISKTDVFMDGDDCSKNGVLNRKISFGSFPVYSAYAFWIRGEYWNNDLTKRFEYNQMVYYNIKQNDIGYVKNETRQNFINVCKVYESK